MMRIFFTAALAAAAVAALVPKPAYAVDYPWCVASRDGVRDCSYVTYEQCLLAASGIGGCVPNPRAMR